MAVLFSAGDHEPVMPLFEVVGKGASASPEQMGATALNVGVTAGATAMVMLTTAAHCPGSGVKV